jgi:hypothetical protein
VPSVVEPVIPTHSNVHSLASAASDAPPHSTIVGGGEGGYGGTGAAGRDDQAVLGLNGLYRGERKKDRWGLSGDTKMAASGSIYGNVEVSSDGIIGGAGDSKPSFLSKFGNIQLAGIDTFDGASPSPVASAHTSASGGAPSSPSPSPSPEVEVASQPITPKPKTLKLQTRHGTSEEFRGPPKHEAAVTHFLGIEWN